jgi:hypothetical protein
VDPLDHRRLLLADVDGEDGQAVILHLAMQLLDFRG